MAFTRPRDSVSASDADVIDPPAPTPHPDRPTKASLDPNSLLAEEPGPESYWEGAIKGTPGGEPVTIVILASLAFSGGSVAGQGWFGGYRTEISGAMGPNGDITLQLWVDVEHFRRHAWVCDGVLDESGRLISGGFHVRCDPCTKDDCQGHSGSFELRRQDKRPARWAFLAFVETVKTK